VQHPVAREAAFGVFGAVTNGAEGALDRVAGSNALPVLGGKVEKLSMPK